MMDDLSDIERWRQLAKIDLNQAASEFGTLAPETAAAFAKNLGAPCFTDMVSRLATDAAVPMLRNLKKPFRRKVISGLTLQKARQLRELLAYPPATAGALMAKECLSVPIDATIKEATGYLQSLPQDRKGKFSYIYVTNKDARLEGVIQLRDLIFYPPNTPLEEILRKPVVQVETGMTQLDVARLLQRHRYLALPVVNANQKLVGVISADNALKVFEEEASDDIAKIVGTGAEEIRTRSIMKIMGLRMPWLFINIASGLLCALLLGIFQENLQTVATLFLFVPVILGVSESTGVQGATIVVRNIAMGNVSFKDLGALFLREVLVGILIGCICGFVVGAVASLWQGSHLLGIALAVSMILAVIISALTGLALPIAFRQFKIDPALASGPLVLAICDLQTLFVYFFMASAILAA